MSRLEGNKQMSLGRKIFVPAVLTLSVTGVLGGAAASVVTAGAPFSAPGLADLGGHRALGDQAGLAQQCPRGGVDTGRAELAQFRAAPARDLHERADRAVPSADLGHVL